MNPPNLREANTCASCKSCIYLLSEKLGYCEPYDTNVSLSKVCDSHTVGGVISLVQKNEQETEEKALKFITQNVPELEIKVLQFISNQMLGRTGIKLAHSLKEDLGLDSLDHVELMMAMDQEFNTEISDNDAEKIKTVQDIVEYLTRSKNAN